MGKVRIAVLRGGPSEEFDVSLKTGESVLGALDMTRYEPVDVVISRSGEWIVRGYTRTPQEILHGVDAAFIALHGAYGEDGTLQRLLDTLGVCYTGSGAFPSAIAMNKRLTKEHLAPLGVRMPQHMLVTASSLTNTVGLISAIQEFLGNGAYIIKPVNGGSSVGTAIAHDGTELERVLREVLSVHTDALVEEFIYGREATCGVIDNFRGARRYALPPIEIVPPASSEIFDFTVKYDGSTEEICPGRFSREEKEEIERLAAYVHEVLELRQYSRSDFIVSKDGIYFLEVNTLPGLTPESLMPKALEAVGCAYSDFLDHLLTQTLGGSSS